MLRRYYLRKGVSGPQNILPKTPITWRALLRSLLFRRAGGIHGCGLLSSDNGGDALCLTRTEIHGMVWAAEL